MSTEKPRVDFGNAIILITGKESVWKLWQLRNAQDGKPYILEKKANRGGAEGDVSSIAEGTEFRGDRVIIGVNVVALYSRGTLLINTDDESTALIE